MGAEFELYKDGERYPNAEKTYITDENGEIVVNNLPYGTYYFVEISAPEGFVLPKGDAAESSEVVINEATTVSTVDINIIAVANEKIYGSLKLTKVDADGNELTGAEFYLVQVIDGEERNIKVDGADGTYVYDKTAGFLSTRQVLVTNGAVLSVTGLPYGTYRVYEDKAPEGYNKDNPGLVIDDPNREGLLRFGKSYAYGAELMLKYDFAKWSGWLGYTWSKSMYDIPEINGGKPYRSPLNHQHAVNFVLTYDFTPQWTASADWVFYSGSPTTFPVGKFKFGDTYASIYNSRNEDSMPDYHRLDLSVTYRTKGRVQERRWSGEWNLSLYDAYARHNAWSMAFGYNRETGETECRKVYLFTIIPSISYNIQF